MKFDRLRIVLFSPCGGSAKVARAISADLDLPIVEHDLTLPGGRMEKITFSPEDLVIMGFPVYGGHMPRNLEKIFANLEGNGAHCVIVAVYGNRAFEGALIDLYDAAVLKGFTPVAAVAAVAEHSMAPTIATDRPDEQDRAHLAEFGRKILAHAENGGKLEKAPGAHPDWKIPEGASFFPITDLEKCTACGKCVEVCPTGAIPSSSPVDTDIQNCIICAACAKYCPQEARIMGTHQTHEMFRPHLVTAAASRKNAELFL